MQRLRNHSATNITVPSTVMYERSYLDDNGDSIVEHIPCRVTAIAEFAFRD